MFRSSKVRIAQPVSPAAVPQEPNPMSPDEVDLSTFIPLTAFRVLQALPKKQLNLKPDSNPKSKK